MQTLSSSLDRKRARSPEVQFDSIYGFKRRAIMDEKPTLYVDTRVPPRPTPEPAFYTATSPFKPYTTYTDNTDYSTAYNWAQQNVWYPAAANWTQRVEVMHSTVSTDQQPYHSETGFLEACRSSAEPLSSYSIFSILSGLSSSHNPFEDMYSTMPSKSHSPLTTQAETNIKDSINTINMQLRKLHDMLEDITQVLKVSRRP